MKTILSFLVLSLLVISVMPAVIAPDTGIGIGIDIEPEEFGPRIWGCDARVVLEDCVEAGRISDCPNNLVERLHNYAFEGEQIGWDVLVMDKNKIEEVTEVVATIGTTQGVGNDIEVECVEVAPPPVIPAQCNARIGEEDLTGTPFDDQTQGYYRCLFTVETPESMYDEYFLTVEAIAVDGEAIMDENEYWFFNPVLALTVDGDVEFMEVRPGSVAYSSTILVGNDADEGSGVMMDMFISGTDFYDPDNSGARCPTTNHLKLSQDLRSQANLGPALNPGVQFGAPCDITQNGGVLPAGWINTPAQTGVDNHDHLCYYATSGSYGTQTDPRADTEGYVPIVYSDVFTRDFYNDAEIIWNGFLPATYSAGNVLSPGSEIAVTFKLGLPEPCVGNFNEGDIYFWGEAI